MESLYFRLFRALDALRILKLYKRIFKPLVVDSESDCTKQYDSKIIKDNIKF